MPDNQIFQKKNCSYICRRVVLAMGLYYYGLQATSAAYSVVFLNLIPIVTFVIAILVRYAKQTKAGMNLWWYACLPFA